MSKLAGHDISVVRVRRVALNTLLTSCLCPRPDRRPGDRLPSASSECPHESICLLWRHLISNYHRGSLPFLTCMSQESDSHLFRDKRVSHPSVNADVLVGMKNGVSEERTICQDGASAGVEESLESHEVIELHAFIERKAWIEEKIKVRSVNMTFNFRFLTSSRYVSSSLSSCRRWRLSLIWIKFPWDRKLKAS